MSRISGKFCAGLLSLAFILAVASQADAQHWRRYRDRDRDLSNGKKVAIIGGGAAAGAVIGALLGGKKGALIGGLVGGGAGTGYVVLKDRDDDRDDTFYRGRYRRDWRDRRDRDRYDHDRGRH